MLLFYDPHLNPGKGFYGMGFDSTVGTAPIFAYFFIGLFLYLGIRVWWEFKKHGYHTDEEYDELRMGNYMQQHGQKID